MQRAATVEGPRGALLHAGSILALVAVIFIVNAVSFTQAALVVDSGRDIANAWSVASGRSLPLSGPEIFGTWKLGPAWFYILAVPLALGGGLTSVALWIGLLASLKIPLAFLLGRHHYGLSGGLALAGAVAIPGWNSAGGMVLAHTSVVESAVFASLLLSLRAFRDPSAARLMLAAAALSLAVHAHPTALAVAPWLAAAFVARLRRGAAVLPLLAGVFLFALPWLPAIYADALAGWPQLEGSRKFAATIDVAARTISVIDMARGLLTGWTPLVADFFLATGPVTRAVLACFWYTGLALAAAGLLKGLLNRQRLTQLLALQWAGSLWFVAVLREGTPVYMLFATFPFACWAFVDGLSNLLQGRRFTFGAYVLVLAALLLQAAMFHQRNEFLQHGTMPVPGAALSDVRAPVGSDGWTRFWLAASDQEAAARSLCGDSHAAHGELAGVLALGAGVAVERACGVDSGLKFGGKDSRRHLVGLSRSQADLLGIEGRSVVRGWVLVEASEVVYPATGSVEKSYTRYAAEDYKRLAEHPPSPALKLAVDCPAGQVLVINNLMPLLNQVATSASDGAASLNPTLTNIGAAYYECPDSQLVELSVGAVNLDAVDIFLLRRTPPDSAAVRGNP